MILNLLSISYLLCMSGMALAQAQLGADIDGEAAADESGSTVSLSSDGYRIAIGAVANDGNGNNSGHVRVYQWSNDGWEQLGADIDGEAANDTSGRSVSLSSDGNRLAIGAPQNGNGDVTYSSKVSAYLNRSDTVLVNPEDSGHVRVYQWSGTAWTQLGTDIDGEAAYDDSGGAVSLSSNGNRLAIGARYNWSNGRESGHVRVYQWSDTAWVQLGHDIDGNSERDQFGRALSLSSDGNRLAVGVPYSDSNGSDSGQVITYQWSGAAWTQVGAGIDGEAADDLFGESVSLNSDGTRLAIGAPKNDGNGTDSGHVRIYQWSDNALRPLA